MSYPNIHHFRGTRGTLSEDDTDFYEDMCHFLHDAVNGMGNAVHELAMTRNRLRIRPSVTIGLSANDVDHIIDNVNDYRSRLQHAENAYCAAAGIP